MKSIRRATFIGVLMVAAAHSASAQTIDFNDGTNGAPIGTFYSGLGATFLNASWTDVFGCCGFNSTSDGYQSPPGNPITVVFSSAISSASLLGQDVGVQGFVLQAFDAAVGGALVSSSSAFGSGAGVGQNFTLTVSGANIMRVEVSQNSIDQGDGILFDDLSFTAEAVAAPEPASLVLLATGLLGVAGVVRRRRVA